MKKLILLITLIISSYLSFAQDASVFMWTSNRMDSIVKKNNPVLARSVVNGRRGVVNVKYLFKPINNLVGLVCTYQNNKLICMTTVFTSNQEFINLVQHNINNDKAVKKLSISETEMVIYNTHRMIYTILTIDTEKKLLYMTHMLRNPTTTSEIKTI